MATPHSSAPLTVVPWIMGSGGSALAIEGALRLLGLANPSLRVEAVRAVPRGTKFRSLDFSPDTALLCLATPHALHGAQVAEAIEAGFRRIAVEKPIAVTAKELVTLPSPAAHIAVFHGYRALWGPQELRRLLDAGELGDVVSIEGRYRQSSAAQSRPKKPGAWKDDVKLSGAYDVALDLGTHWVDLATFLAKAPPSADRAKSRVRRSYVRADSPHRDTHAHFLLEHDNGVRSAGTISKLWHGAVNELEITVIGSEGAGTWRFDRPDELVLGKGGTERRVVRPADQVGWSRLPAGHGMGWLGGYVAVLEGLLAEWSGASVASLGRYPSWNECAAWLAPLLQLLEAESAS